MELLTTNNPQLRERIPDGFNAELRKLYFDCALSYAPTTLNALAGEVGMDRLLAGSDYPFGPKQQMVATTRGIAALPWTDVQKQQLRTDNASTLFPRRFG